MKTHLAAGCVLAVGAQLVAVPAARAQETRAEPAAAAGEREIAPRPWLYLDDPTLPGPLQVVAFARSTYTSDDSPTRPFGANVSRPGGVVEAGGEVGVLPRLSLAASGFGGGDRFGFGALAGARLEPFRGLWRTTHAVLSGGYLRELAGGDGAWLRLAVSQDIARLRLGATVHGEHVFAPGRDGIDVLVMAGASYAVAGPLHAGVEYVAQDLEEALGDRAEGGVRHFLGPQLSLDLMDKHLSVVGGPAFGLGPTSPPFAGRVSIAYQY